MHLGARVPPRYTWTPESWARRDTTTFSLRTTSEKMLECEAKSSLQEIVGVPLSEEDKAKLPMGFGYQQHIATEMDHEWHKQHIASEMAHEPAETPKTPDETESGASAARGPLAELHPRLQLRW